MTMHRRRIMGRVRRPVTAALAAALAAGALALGGCSENGDEAPAGAPSAPLTDSLAAILASSADLSATARILEQTGLSQALDEAPYYTVLAPTNAAMEAFAQQVGGAEDGAGGDEGAALAAIMRAHILPGYLTTADIGAAIDAHGGSVTMQTMAGAALSFTREGESVRVTAADGASALIAGSGLGGSNGVILPIDAVLKRL